MTEQINELREHLKHVDIIIDILEGNFKPNRFLLVSIEYD
jgi:hypothetical protein